MRHLGLLLTSVFAFSTLACGGSKAPAEADTTQPDDTGTVEADTGFMPAMDDSGPEVDNGAPSTTYPAPHPAFPQLVNQAGGQIIKTPKVVVMFFPGYVYKTKLETFAKTVGATDYWKSAVSEWGIGPIEFVSREHALGGSRIRQDSGKRLVELMRHRARQLTEESDATEVRELTPLVLDLTLGSASLGDVAHHCDEAGLATHVHRFARHDDSQDLSLTRANIQLEVAHVPIHREHAVKVRPFVL